MKNILPTVSNKKFSLPFIIFILLSSMVSFGALRGAGTTENPYDEGNWKLSNASLHIIQENDTELEQEEPGIGLSNIWITVGEEESWANIDVHLEERDEDKLKPYWQENEVPEFTQNISFDVRKSNNIAYHEDDLIGFNPFWVYEYTDTEITVEEGEIRGKATLDLDRKYEVSYASNSFGVEHCLVFRSQDEIEFMRKIGGEAESSQRMIEISAKGRYPVNIGLVLPNEYILTDPTSEGYVYLTANLREENQEEAYEFLETVDNGGKPYSVNILPWNLIIIPALIIPSVYFGYKAYQKKKG